MLVAYWASSAGQGTSASGILSEERVAEGSELLIVLLLEQRHAEQSTGLTERWMYGFMVLLA